MMRNFWGLIKGNIPIVSLSGLLLLAILIYPVIGDRYANEITLVRIAIAALLGYILIFGYDKNWNHDRFFKNITLAGVLSITVAFLVAVYLIPEKIVIIASEDNIIENISALLLFISSALSLGLAFRFWQAKDFTLVYVAFLFMAVFFFLGMEEISWMQRVLHIESAGVFLEYNMQAETNLHNFNSRISNDIYYTGAFLVLTLLPYYRSSVVALMKRFKLSKMTAFIPRRWLLLPFAVASGFVLPSTEIDTVNIVILILSILIILREVVMSFSRKDYIYATACSVVLLVIITAVAGSFFSGLVRSGYINIFQEYRELIISIGLMVYTADLYLHNFYKHVSDKFPR